VLRACVLTDQPTCSPVYIPTNLPPFFSSCQSPHLTSNLTPLLILPPSSHIPSIHPSSSLPFSYPITGNSSVPYVSFAFFLYYMSTLGEVSIEILFQKRTFHFSPVMIGCFGSLGGLMQCLSMIAMPSVFFYIFKVQLEDIYWIEIGLWWKVVYYACFGLAAQARQLFFILPILLFCGPIVPRTRSYLSKAVKNGQQTELFVAIAALEAVGAALGPSLTLGYVSPCHTVPYHILFFSMLCHIMSYHVMSCHVMSCHVMSYHVISCHTMSYHAIRCTTPYHTVLSYSILCYASLSLYLALSSIPFIR
jgi:hypothetical protein